MSKNYFSNFDINKGSFGFSLFNTSFVNNTPTTITSGSGGLTLSVVGGGLRNKVSLELNKPSAINTQGQGLISDVLTLDRADLARVLRFAFEFERTSGTIDASGTPTSSFEVWIYDVTNAQWIQPSGFRGITQITLPGTCSGEFQPPSTALALRLAIIYRQTDTNTWTMRFDEFELLQQSRARGAIVTDWQDFIPTWFGSTTNPAIGNGTLSGKFRRVGDIAQVQIGILMGTTSTYGSGTYSFGLPSGLNIDLSKLTLSGLGDRSLIGNWVFTDSGVEVYTGNVQVNNSSQVFLRVLRTLPTAPNPISAGAVIGNASFPYSVNDNFTINFEVPIAGWSSSVQVSSDTDTRVVAAKITTSSARTINNTMPTIIYENTVLDTHGAYNNSNGEYRVPVSGVYEVSGGFTVTGTSTTVGHINVLRIFKNGTLDTDLAATAAQTTTAIAHRSYGSATVICSAGDVLTFRFFADTPNTLSSGAGAISNHISIKRISGPSQIAASEPVYASATSTAGQSIATATDTILNLTAKDYDSHNALTTGASARFTAPVRGLFNVAAMIRFNTGQSFTSSNIISILLYKNGVIYKQMANFLVEATNASTGYVPLSGSADVPLNAGEYIEVRVFQNSGGTRNLEANGSTNWVAIKKVD